MDNKERLMAIIDAWEKEAKDQERPAFWEDFIDRIAAANLLAPESTGETSDGYHTFNELYRFRRLYNAALFNEWATLGKFSVHKSKRHHDGEECFGGGWFIVVAILPGGQISNHYELADWNLFKVPEAEKALFEFDGHSPADIANRLESLILPAAPKDNHDD
jgi:hypothetical protein